MKPLHLCAKCRFPLDPKNHVHSTYTDLRYCSDLDDCDRRCRNDLTWEEIAVLSQVAMIMLGEP